MKKVCALIGKYFGVIAVIFLIIGMTLPTSFSWVLGKVGGISVLSVLLGVIMFGMGMTMSVHDFALVLKRPKDVFFGACAQYFVMPFLAYVLSTIFQLDPALTVGVVLVGTCPGGTSSNVITFMSKGDVPLSVTMTSVSTLISPIMTPLLTYLIIGQRISFDPVGMFLSILQIVIVPIALGLIVKSFLPKLADTAADYLPAVSALAISFLIAGIIGASRDAILNSSGIILLVERHDTPLGDNEKLVRRSLSRIGEARFRDLLAIKKGDAVGQGTSRDYVAQLFKTEALLNRVLAQEQCFSLRQLAVNGADLQALGLRGRPVGEMLHALLDAVIDGRTDNRRETLLRLARTRMEEQHDK